MKGLKEIRIVSMQRGISKKTGNPYLHTICKGIREDGSSIVKDFWIMDEKVMNQITEQGIQEDDFVTFELGFDENFRAVITDVFLEDKEN